MAKHTPSYGILQFTGLMCLVLGFLGSIICVTCVERSCSPLLVLFVFGGIGIACFALAGPFEAWEKRRDAAAQLPLEDGARPISVRDIVLTGLVLLVCGGVLTIWSVEWGVLVGLLGVTTLYHICWALYKSRGRRSEEEEPHEDASWVDQFDVETPDDE
jgi:hypothetical protein